jgi:hypothetical protein
MLKNIAHATSGHDDLGQRKAKVTIQFLKTLPWQS